MDVPRWLSLSRRRGPGRNRDAPFAGGAAQRVHGGHDGEARAGPDRGPGVPVHPPKRPARPHPRAARRRRDDRVEQRPVRLLRAPVRGVDELRVLGSLTMTHRRTLVAGGLSIVLLAAACHEEDLIVTPPPPYAGGAMFARYVSFGNSVTAGFQSGGLNDSLQLLAYHVLLARAMQTTFYYPSINYVPSLDLYGCPS